MTSDVVAALGPVVERRMEDALAGAERRFFMATPEDTVLHKLTWYRDGGQVSDWQWSDILGVLRV